MNVLWYCIGEMSRLTGPFTYGEAYIFEFGDIYVSVQSDVAPLHYTRIASY